MEAISVASIAAATTLIAAFLTQFLAERYRRFQDGTAIAAGIAGELASYSAAFDLLDDALTMMADRIARGEREELWFRPHEKPVDRFFVEVVGRIGLLGPDLAKRIIYIYSNLDAFRAALVAINAHHADMQDGELSLRVMVCHQALQRAASEAKDTMPLLHARIGQWFLRLDRVLRLATIR